jgi:hypothetical protein
MVKFGDIFLFIFSSILPTLIFLTGIYIIYIDVIMSSYVNLLIRIALSLFALFFITISIYFEFYVVKYLLKLYK